MKPITKVITTSLYWETLGELRNTPRYEKVRESINNLVRMKAERRGPVNGRDQMFAVKSLPALYGLWHCAISRSPDVVLFYAVNDDTLTLGMLGTHDDFPNHRSTNTSRLNGVGTRIRNSMAEGHVPSPRWTDLKWSRPGDLIEHPEVEELSSSALTELLEVLEREATDAPLFERLHGRPILDCDEPTIDAWLSEVEKAHGHVCELVMRPHQTSRVTFKI
jgi:mRNA-degrading endonuclease YafQ of YafQ-DinJ toxin-antitoxin module